jgi:hypothetical protein
MQLLEWGGGFVRTQNWVMCAAIYGSIPPPLDLTPRTGPAKRGMAAHPRASSSFRRRSLLRARTRGLGFAQTLIRGVARGDVATMVRPRRGTTYAGDGARQGR